MVQLQSRPALFISDMQNAFCHPNGSFGKSGLPISNHMAIVPSINKLRALFRSLELPVLYTRLGYADDYSDSGILLENLTHFKDMNAFVRGSWDVDIIDKLRPTEGEIVVDKTRNTAFWGTDFAKILEEKGVNQLVATGVGTNVCVESTVRDAFTNGMHVITVSDATATLSEEDHQASLKSLMWFGGTASVEEIEEALEKNRDQVPSS